MKTRYNMNSEVVSIEVDAEGQFITLNGQKYRNPRSLRLASPRFCPKPGTEVIVQFRKNQIDGLAPKSVQVNILHDGFSGGHTNVRWIKDESTM